MQTEAPQELVPLNLAAREIFRRVYLPFHHPQSAPAPDQLNGLAKAICAIAPVYAVDGAAARRLRPEEISEAFFRGGARELLFLDERAPIRNLAVASSEVERAARLLGEALSG